MSTLTIDPINEYVSQKMKKKNRSSSILSDIKWCPRVSNFLNHSMSRCFQSMHYIAMNNDLSEASGDQRRRAMQKYFRIISRKIKSVISIQVCLAQSNKISRIFFSRLGVLGRSRFYELLLGKINGNVKNGAEVNKGGNSQNSQNPTKNERREPINRDNTY